MPSVVLYQTVLPVSPPKAEPLLPAADVGVEDFRKAVRSGGADACDGEGQHGGNGGEAEDEGHPEQEQPRLGLGALGPLQGAREKAAKGVVVFCQKNARHDRV